eukprot:gene5482-7590_t
MATIEYEKPFPCKCYAAMQPNGPFAQYEITRRAVGKRDVAIKIVYAGICHSDIHQVREEWGKATFPMVPGHEIIGNVVAVGEEVTKFTLGQNVGVGCMVASCQKCTYCRRGDEQYCATGCVWTYNDTVKKYDHCDDSEQTGSKVTYGGYSESIVVNENFVVSVPTNLDRAKAVPLLCAGITTYSPIIHFGLKPHHKFAVLGFGGLGHVAAKFGLAFGAHVTVISRGTSKKDSALNELGVHAFLDSTDEIAFENARASFDYILSTVSAPYSLKSYCDLLKVDGKIVIVGAPPCDLTVSPGALLHDRKTVTGSLIGGIQETQEMLDFCGLHNITCDVELITADRIEEAYDRTVKADVKYRFVIDIESI